MPRHLGCGEGRLLDSGLNDLSWTADLKGLLRPKEVELDRLIALEEYYWKAEVPIRVVERIQKFFHHKASHRYSRNSIKGLENSNGEWILERKRYCRRI